MSTRPLPRSLSILSFRPLSRPRPTLFKFNKISTKANNDNMSGNYIVVFKEDVTQDQIDKYVAEVNANGGEVKHRYDSLLNGFSASIPDNVLTSFQNLQGDVIDYIEPDQVVTINQESS